MKNSARNFVACGIPALILAAVFGCSPVIAQYTIPPARNYKEHRTEVLAHAKKYLASDLESNMPRMKMDTWLKTIAGPRQKGNWQIENCTTRKVIPDDEILLETPLCVDASVIVTHEYAVHILMEYGRFEPGLAPSKPVIRRIFICEEYDGSMASVKFFRELPTLSRSLKRSLALIDPNHAQFTISGKLPAGFEPFSLYFRTHELGEYFEKKNAGEIETDDRKLYILKNILFDGERLSFKTSVTGGASYSFAGRFLRSQRNKDAASVDKYRILRGRIYKIVKGRRSLTADVYFDLTLLGDFG